MPLADYFRLRVRILSLGTLHNLLLWRLRTESRVKPPLDSITLFVLFLVGSFVPPMLVKLLHHCCFKKETPRMFDESTFTYC